MNNIIQKIISTKDDSGALVARVALGIVILPHGAQKLLGMFGGYGFTGTMDFFTHQMRIPYPFALLAIIAEFFGGLGLIVGLLSRVAAFGIASTLLVAMLTVHLANGFFMNWFGAQKGEGIEYFILALALAAIVIVRGGGKFSLDRKLS